VRVLRLVLLSLVPFALGIMLGSWLAAHRTDQTVDALAEMVARLQDSVDEEAAYSVYRLGDFSQVTCGLMPYVSQVEARLAQRDAALRPQTARRLALAYSWLAMSAQRAGDRRSQAELLGLARGALSRVGGQATEEQLLAQVQDLDRERDLRMNKCRTAEPIE